MIQDGGVRGWHPDDLAGIVDLLATACPRESLTAEKMATRLLLQPGGEPGDFLVAEHAGQPIGVLHATDDVAQGRPTAWITLLAVQPRAQCSGVGTALLEECLARLRPRGVTTVRFSDDPRCYFLPGLDKEEYPAADRFFSRQGFTTRATCVAQRATIPASFPDGVRTLIERRRTEGFTFTRADWANLPLAMECAERSARGWGAALADAVRCSRRPDRITLAIAPTGQVVGFSTFASIDEEIGRFGPIGVDPGAKESFFLWGETHGPAFDMYARAGFEVDRTFHLLERQL